MWSRQWSLSSDGRIDYFLAGSDTADGVSNLLENLNIKENIKHDNRELDIETALESLKFQVFVAYLQSRISSWFVLHKYLTAYIAHKIPEMKVADSFDLISLIIVRRGIWLWISANMSDLKRKLRSLFRKRQRQDDNNAIWWDAADVKKTFFVE